MDRVYGHVDDFGIERFLEIYVLEGEHQDGEGFWDHFNTVKDIIDDFKRFIDSDTHYGEAEHFNIR